MAITTHYENASFLRELAESLPRLRPQEHKAAQAEHDDWLRTKVAVARADSRPPLGAEEVALRLRARSERFARSHTTALKRKIQ